MTKEQIIETILRVSNDMNLNAIAKYKSNKWKADVVVDYNNYKVAFNVCKSPRSVETAYNEMKSERVCGCWLLLPSDKSVYIDGELQPCFKLTDRQGETCVYLNSKFNTENSDVISLEEFISSIIKGNIRRAKKMNLNFIDVCFFKESCWKCGKENDVYFINRLLSNNGISILYNDCCIEDDLELNPIIVDSIIHHIKNHPELKIVMGDIKSRYSNTIQSAYPSFGCAYCDSLFGNFFIQESVSELRYCTDSLPQIRVEVLGDISIPVNCWFKINA